MTTAETPTAESSSDRPTALFLCVHNAGRSQMAAGWLRHLAGDQIDVYSAGSNPGDGPGLGGFSPHSAIIRDAWGVGKW